MKTKVKSDRATEFIAATSHFAHISLVRACLRTVSICVRVWLELLLFFSSSELKLILWTPQQSEIDSIQLILARAHAEFSRLDGGGAIQVYTKSYSNEIHAEITVWIGA